MVQTVKRGIPNSNSREISQFLPAFLSQITVFLCLTFFNIGHNNVEMAE